MNNSLEQQPDPISFQDHVFDFSFHPTHNLVAVGLINGNIQCHRYSTREENGNSLVWSTQASKKSCRGVEFTQSGQHLISISRDKSIQALDVATGRLLYKIPKAHKYAINKICKFDTHLTATGDDEGVVKIWDMRTCKAIQEYKVHDDFISDIKYCESKSSLIAAGGEGLLSIYDIRKPTDKIKITDELDDEILSISVIKNDTKVVAGSQSGALYTWDWNQWDRAPTTWLGHPSSIDTICNIGQEAICTGGSDGLLRMISIEPNKFEGVLGDHGGQDFPIESVKLDYQQQYLASCGHDLQLRFWNVQFLFKEEGKEDGKDVREGEEEEEQLKDKMMAGEKRKDTSQEDDNGQKVKKPRKKGSTFFQDM